MRADPPSKSSDLPSLLPEYAELHCLSNFTFLHGASHPEELVLRASQLGYAALALTDECSLAGVVRAHGEAKQCGLHLIIGSFFRLTHADGRPAFSLILLAADRDGYGNLSELITLARTRAQKGSYLLTPDDFTAPQQDHAHLRGMPGCLALLLPLHGLDAEELDSQAAWMARVFPSRAWIALTLLHHPGDDRHRALVGQAAGRHGVPIAATGNVCMHVRSRKPLQDTLTAIRLGKPIAECGYDLAPNAEQHLRSRLRLANIYPPAALAETLRIAGLCGFSLDELRYEYPDELVPQGYTPAAYLRREVYAGAMERFPEGVPPAVQQQLEHELALIEEKRYEAYFLTVYDIVRFARSVGILCQGRGSAANSVVCYCLRITEVDPSRSTLLFERFISRERDEPPDIDVDFEHQRREEVIQYIYGKYGRLRAALTAVVISYKPRSVLRDVGKALGVDAGIVDQVAKSHRWWDGKNSLAERFAECGMEKDSLMAVQWADIAEKLMRFPRHLSQHPGGFIISRGKLSRLVPIENAAMKDRSVVQWDKDDIDALGLLKVDILALGMLSMIRRALDFITDLRGEPFNLQDIPREDPATYAMISRADTIGVFQIESRAQMTMLPRLRPREFYDLVIQVAIVRPGPIQGGMVHPYLRRRQGLEPVTYPSDKIRQALSRTLGVAIFQEQVMQIAILAAEFTAGEADQLRRAMAAWRRKGDIGKFQDKLIAGMRRNGYEEEFISAIVRQIHGFAEYGFPESHAASFALLAYASSWIKCHEPAAFLAALLNSQPMGFYSPSQLVQDARRHNVTVRPVDIRYSDWDARLEWSEGEAALHMPDGPRWAGTENRSMKSHPGQSAQPAVRLGFNMVRGLSCEAAWRIEEARSVKPFPDLADLALRAQLSRHDLEMLANANALEALAGHRRQALWHAVASEPGKGLLRGAGIEEEPVRLDAPTEGEGIVADYHSTGVTLGRHPLALLRTALAARRFLPADILHTFADRQLARACGIVTVRQRPETANGTMFVTLEDETGLVNVIVWPALIERYRKELLGSQLLGVYGVWQCESNVHHLVAGRLVDMSGLLGRLQFRSRDFA
ncbi:error-prone DNA polymerase [Noviherbaspirillum sp. CPCC 100848]|uniref:Error-prone DNA polymerase n=1 Tax=Noviherbaspirillum album TaxID=3080276 RepID=A0ABU6JDS6_9BURK|nr:error-prone DNA polymerase [Noviherbaspirillum sp. CPCC 100848]MEC4721805.1 error-prone DNA polymerase [Noviherbaspirillum sp. CPCC 100848]